MKAVCLKNTQVTRKDPIIKLTADDEKRQLMILPAAKSEGKLFQSTTPLQLKLYFNTLMQSIGSVCLLAESLNKYTQLCRNAG